MGFIQDLRYAVLILRNAPGLAAIAVLSLALGIGVNTAIFSVINTVLLQPLSYPDPDRLVRIWETFEYSGGVGHGTVSLPNLFDWREESSSFEGMGAYSIRNLTLTRQGEPILVRGSLVTVDLLALLGVEPIIGRTFRPEDGRPGSEEIVMLSHGFWQLHYGADPEVIGRTLAVNGAPHTIVGIMPQGFQAPPRLDVQLWAPLIFSERNRQSRGSHWLNVIGRLRPGIEMDRARTEMEGIAGRLELAYPDAQDKRSVLLMPLHESLVRNVRPVLLTLWGAVGFVLLISSANVANLLLARAVRRRREVAIRASLGAGRLRLIRQLLSESLLLASIGGFLGLFLGIWSVDLLASLPGSTIPAGVEIQLDLTVLFFCCAVSALTAIISGLAPALRTSQTDLVEALKDRTTVDTGGRDRLRSALIVVEVALSLVVIVGAGLLVRSYGRLLDVDPGFETERVLSLPILPSPAKYEDLRPLQDFYQALQRRTAAIPGISSTGLIGILPVDNWGTNSNFIIDGDPPLPSGLWPLAEMRTVVGDYFQTMDVPLLRGRLLDERDDGGASRGVLVNQTLVNRFFEGSDPLGKRVYWGPPPSDDLWMTVVGVVGDVRNAGLSRDPLPVMYFPMALRARLSMTLTVRTEGDPTLVVEAVRAAQRELDPGQPATRARVMSEVIADWAAPRRFSLLLFSIFAAAALLLALAGIYGVLSYSVSRRTHEIAVRMAIGAGRRSVFVMVLRGGLALSLAGVALGVGVSIWLTRFLESQLFSIRAHDPLTLIAASLLMIATTLIACAVPVRRATRVEPVVALRSE